MRLAARQAVVIDKDAQLALAQGGAVEMRQVIDCRAGRVHRRLVDQMYLAEEAGLARQCTGHRGQTRKKRHRGRPMFFEHGVDQAGERLDRIESRLGNIRFPGFHGKNSEPWGAEPGAKSEIMSIR
jgi:hypothetical protein